MIDLVFIIILGMAGTMALHVAFSFLRHNADLTGLIGSGFGLICASSTIYCAWLIYGGGL